MGYTHYWETKRELTKEEVRGICQDARAILECTGVALGNAWGEESPIINELADPDEWFVALNGVERDGCESFVLAAAAQDFAFCKTRGRPYDEVVTAILIAAADRAPEVFRYSSDGDAQDWASGQALAQAATGRPLPIKLSR